MSSGDRKLSISSAVTYKREIEVYKLSCVTLLLREHIVLLFLTIQSTTVIGLIPLEFINFNRNGIRLPREAISISKAKTLKPYAMNRREETLSVYISIFIVPFVCFCTSFNFRIFQPFIFHL